jgi:hypothetical protein
MNSRYRVLSKSLLPSASETVNPKEWKFQVTEVIAAHGGTGTMRESRRSFQFRARIMSG